MLKNIRLHLEKDEEKQQVLEEKLARHITKVHNENINSFRRNIPSLLPYVNEPVTDNISIFCNKYGEYNIVDYGLGRTFYGLHPEREVKKQYECFAAKSTRISLTDTNTPSVTESVSDKIQDNPLDFTQLDAFAIWQADVELPSEVDCLVVLGCGLGLHLEYLLQHHKIKHLIIYEPEIQFFKCSALVSSWKKVFELAKKHSTGIYLQLGKDGRDIIADINELSDNFAIGDFYLYKHYNHLVFDSVFQQLRSESWNKLQEKGLSFNFTESYLDYCSPWTVDLTLGEVSAVEKSDLFNANLQAFSKFYPDIYEKFKDYTPNKWLPVKTKSGDISLVKKNSLTSWYSDDVRQECEYNFENFEEQPNKDSLVLGYNGTKLAHYLHYKFVKKTEDLLKEVEENQGSLPEEIQSIIMFGIGIGYQLEYLFQSHSIEHMFICEPNPDFFYGSLFAIDWQSILEKLEQSEARLYLNIGDDGTNLFRDLLNQFYSIGPYILNNTYFYQSYYNASLNQAIAQLREQLQVVISMGEYFDHAYYGITQTQEGFAREFPLLVKNPASKLSYDNKQTPIFLVGNGPSLDHSIETIKEWQGNAIVVSCGTSLKVLYKHGITPDFHAEIEQNRSTFDWAALIGDLDYLKQITLLSCNGIHPDTASLYKEVFIALKEGESSTVSAGEILDKAKFEVLSFAFPTVSNFASNLFSKMGFEAIYLVGVDLGFVDAKKHHSSKSGYYTEEGNELYDYSEKNNTSLVVPGNFRATVFTKNEFKVAKQIMEQTIYRSRDTTSYYNCSDGAKIIGSHPLLLENILVTNTEDDKRQAVDRIKSHVFNRTNGTEFRQKFVDKFSPKLLKIELEVFEKCIGQEIKTFKQAEALINKQKELLFHSYSYGKSLLFYYLYGTVNYSNAVLVKLLHATAEKKMAPEGFKQGLELWRAAFSKIKNRICEEQDNWDTSNFYQHPRETVLNKLYATNKKMLIVTNSQAFADCANWMFCNYFKWDMEAQIVNYQSLESLQDQTFDFVLYDDSPEIANGLTTPKLTGEKSTLTTLYGKTKLSAFTFPNTNLNLSVMCVTQSERSSIANSQWFADLLTVAHLSIMACIQGHKKQVIIPKYVFKNGYNKNDFEKAPQLNFDVPYVSADFTWYLAVSSDESAPIYSLLPNGTRGKPIERNIDQKQLVYCEFSEDVYTTAAQKRQANVPSIDDQSQFAGRYFYHKND